MTEPEVQEVITGLIEPESVAPTPAAADEIEAVIETAPSPPERKRKGMLGNMKGRKNRR